MHDIRWIRENADEIDAGLSRRGLDAAAAGILALDAKYREAQTKVQEAKSRRNEASKEIGAAKKRGEDAAELITKVGQFKELIREGDEEGRQFGAEIEALLLPLPNLPAPGVPDGLDEAANIEVRRVGELPNFNFKVRDHVDIGEGLGMMDFEAAARMSGARFVVLKKDLARLERALANFMLDIQTEEFGFQETKPPSLVRDLALFGTGQLPKFEEDLFHTDNGFWLIPTAEVPLTNLVREQIITQSELPIRRTAYTSCYRSEAGSAGKDTRGMLRQHEFTKVEMVSITHPDCSDDELEFMTGCAEEVLKRLGLAYRVIVLSCGDMGFSARKTYDIEVWLPAQDTFREISSCSNCGDFQARRMHARFRPNGEAKGTRFVHTLNGSGLAVGRTLIAVLENYQQADGSVVIPEALRPYMFDRKVIHGEA